MNRINIVICFILYSVAAFAHAENAAEENSIVLEQQTHKVFQGAMYQIWVKLRSLNPKPQAEERAGRGQLVATAGIRGAESTETALKPYWKDDRTEDKAFLEQVESLNAAQSMLDEGKIKEAGVALESFMQRYPEGELLPNALFTRGMAQAAGGDKSGSGQTLKQFVKNYPQHPLKADAEIVIAEMSK